MTTPELDAVTLHSSRSCPICGDGKSTVLFRQSFGHLSAVHLLDGYDVVVCQNCGAGFADHIPPQAVFDEYYRELSKYDYADRAGTEPPGAEQRFLDIADVLETAIPNADCRILEIGCASGQLLKILRQRGFSCLLGADPSPGCVRVAQEHYGVPAIVSTIFTVPQPETPYDFLILIGVMEHISDLDGAVQQFRHLLRDGGRLYLETPDASRYAPDRDAPFQEFSTEHINFFSAQSLTNLMQTRGFRTLLTGHAIRPQHEVTCPAVYAVYEKSATTAPVERDLETEAGLRAYIDGCQAEDTRIRAKIDQSLPPGNRMIVWGVGAHTLRLLATGGLDPAKIALFVDSNPKYQNQELCGIPVVSPDALTHRPEPILISSRGFQREIKDQIRNGLGLMNPLIVLYES